MKTKSEIELELTACMKQLAELAVLYKNNPGYREDIEREIDMLKARILTLEWILNS